MTKAAAIKGKCEGAKYLKMDNEIKSKWDFLLQCRPEIRSMIGNSKLLGGHISHSSNHQKIFKFITKKGIFTYNETTDEFKSKVQIR